MRNGAPHVIGVDLGTTTCLACVMWPGQPEPVVIRPDPTYRSDVMPSAFCLTDDGPLVGEAARKKLGDPRFSDDVVRFVKRFLHQPERKFYSNGAEYDAVDISAEFLAHLRLRASQELGTPITRAVITVPAYFGNLERTRTRDAAERAGFERDHVHLLDEPIAAAYGMGLHEDRRKQLVIVADLGGGTFDVTLLKVGYREDEAGFHELARDGDSGLGGLEWDREIARLAAYNLGIPPGKAFMDFRNVELYQECEHTKIALSGADEDPALASKEMRIKDPSTKVLKNTRITKEQFELHTQHLAERCAKICERLLASVPSSELEGLRRRPRGLLDRLRPKRIERLTWEDIDHVLMVGGGSRLKAVQDAISARLGKPVVVASRPQHQVAFGAARVAAKADESELLFKHMHLRTPHSIGYWYYPTGRREDGRKFAKIVERNELFPFTLRCEVPVAGRSDKRLMIELVEERRDLQPRTNKPLVRREPIARLVLPDLPVRLLDAASQGPPAPKGGPRESMIVTLDGQSDRDILFSVAFRGTRGEQQLGLDNGE